MNIDRVVTKQARSRIQLTMAVCLMSAAGVILPVSATNAANARAGSSARFTHSRAVLTKHGLNTGHKAEITSLSCASAGNCSAGGLYRDASAQQAFVANEVKGVWRKAEEVPGSARLNATGYAELSSVSCYSPGYCIAGGQYRDGSGNFQDFLVNETKGVWRTAEEIPGTAKLNSGGAAQLNSVSCASDGSCSAGGDYYTGSAVEAFVVNETKGSWGNAEEVPAMAKLNAGGNAWVASVSCASPGSCAAAGVYRDSSYKYQIFVVNESKGVWGKAKEISGTAKLEIGGNPGLNSLSCASAGACSAGGQYEDGSGNYQAFLVNDTKGVWGAAHEVPATATLNSGGDARINSISCSGAGDCSAGGSYKDASNGQHAFLVSESKGVWGAAREVPGTANLNVGHGAAVLSVSCASPGYCSDGGFYADLSTYQQAFVVSEANGVWGTAEEVPGAAKLNAGDADVDAVSCASPRYCSAAGGYYDGQGSQVFVVDEIKGVWGTAEKIPGM